MSARPAAEAAPSGPVEALQEVLAAEHAAVWVLAFLGARVSASDQPDLAARLTASFEAHRVARDQVTDLLDDQGADPVAAEPDYALPSPAGSPAELEAAALQVEQRVTAAYAVGVRGTSEDARRWVLTGLQASAVRSLGFGAPPTDLPGLG